jgi:hypothetical protein
MIAEADSTRFERFAALVILSLFGVTWPILDLLGRNAEFFLARRSSTAEIVGVATLMVFVIPVLIGLAGSLPGRIGNYVAAVLILLTSASLARLYLAPLEMAWGLELGLALLAGAGVTWSFFRLSQVRQAARYLLIAPAVMVLVFVFALPVGAVLRDGEPEVGAPLPVANPTPLVVVVFDEFPVADLIDPQGSLRADVYPNFARLAADGIWYRNAVTVEQQTEHSVPAILTGAVPPQSLMPVAGQYPFNLFTALSGAYDLHVHESITQLCPYTLCEGSESHVGSLAQDLGIVGGHVILPDPIASGLPAIDRSWGDFGVIAGDFDAREEFRQVLAAGQRQPVDWFLDEISGADQASMPLFYLHVIIPHHPWQFLPDGRSYPFIVEMNPASFEGGWIDDPFLVAQSMQRHLLQVGFADHVLGEVIDGLESSGWYDEAMMVVVADHGVAIEPGVFHQRIITPESVGDIAPVPLFVKLPGSEFAGTIDDRRALTIDILPTIAELIDVDLPESVEGRSLTGPDPQREQTTTQGTEGPVTFGVDGTEKLELAARIEALFPGGDPWALRPPGAPDLVGQRVDPSSLQGSTDVTTRLGEPQLYEDIDLDTTWIPSRIGGELFGDIDGTELLAVSVNGVIGAVTRSYLFEGEARYLAMVAPDLFVTGANEIALLEVRPDGELRLVDELGS